MSRSFIVGSLLAIFAATVWGSVLLALLATFVPPLAGWLVASGEALVVGSAIVLLLIGRFGTASPRVGRLLIGPYPRMPLWVWLVQMVLILLVWLFWFIAPAGRVDGGVCVVTVAFERVELSPKDCTLLRVSSLRVEMALLLAFGWLPTFQRTVSRPRRSPERNEPDNLIG